MNTAVVEPGGGISTTENTDGPAITAEGDCIGPSPIRPGVPAAGRQSF